MTTPITTTDALIQIAQTLLRMRGADKTQPRRNEIFGAIHEASDLIGSTREVLPQERIDATAELMVRYCHIESYGPRKFVTVGYDRHGPFVR